MASDAVTQGRDQSLTGDGLLKPMPSATKTVAGAKEPTQVPSPTLLSLIDYSLLATLAYSTETKKVYAALEKNAPALYERILPLGKGPKQEVHLATGDNLVRVNLLANGEAGKVEAVVAFVGPDNLKDYEPNDEFPVACPVDKLASWPAGTPDGGAKVHGSFLQAFNDLVRGQGRKNLAQRVQELAASLGVEITKITLVGHAVGGAFATIGSYWIKMVAFKNADVSCVTFGAPRVGTPDFAKAFSATVVSSLRVVHKADPLTDVPSFLSFQHVHGGIHLYEPNHNTSGAPDMGDVPHYMALFMEPPSPLYCYKKADNAVLQYMAGLMQAVAGRNDDALPKTLKQQWGHFLKDGWIFDSPVAEDHELESIVKQLLRFDAGKVRLVPTETLEKLIKYGAWAAAAYAHHVSMSTAESKSAKNTLHYWAYGDGGHDDRGNLVGSEDDLGPVLGDTLRLIKGSGAINRSLLFDTDTQALVGLVDLGGSDVELVVAFRGSEQKLDDWITNFTISMTEVDTLVGKMDNIDPSWKIHSGFTDSVKDIVAPDLRSQKGPFSGVSDGESGNKKDDAARKEYPGLTEIVADILPPGKRIAKVVTCGHSLGGALSKLAAYWCQKVGWPDVPVENYSFGAPRVCNWEFGGEWRSTVKTSWRVVHRSDPVPAVPFAAWLADLDYHHLDDAVLLCQPLIQPFSAVDWPLVAHKEDYQAHLRRRPTPLTAVVPILKLGTVTGDHSMQSRPVPAKGAAKAARSHASPFDVPLVTEPSYLASMTQALKVQMTEMSTVDALKARMSAAAGKFTQGVAELPGMLSDKLSKKPLVGNKDLPAAPSKQ